MNHAHQVHKVENQTVRAFAREAITSAMLRMLARQEMSGMVKCLIEHPGDIQAPVQLHSVQRVSGLVQRGQSSLISRTRKGYTRILSRRRGESVHTAATPPLDEDKASRPAILPPVQLALFSGIENHTQEHKTASTLDKPVNEALCVANDVSEKTVIPTVFHPGPLVRDVETKAHFVDTHGDSPVENQTQEADTAIDAGTGSDATVNDTTPVIPSQPWNNDQGKEHDVTAENIQHEAEEDDIRKVMAALGRIGQEGGEARTDMSNPGIHARSYGRFRVVSNPERVSVPTRLRGTREVMVEHASIAKAPEVRVAHSHADPLASITDDLLVASKRIEAGPQEALRAKSMVEKVRRRLSEMDFRIQAVLGRPRNTLG